MEQTNKLIPELRFPEFVNDGEWKQESINSICEVLNNRRKPITGSERTKGIYPYYGASGIIDYVDNYIFDEKLLLVGEDGAKWGAYENTAFIVDGKYWVNNHAHVLKPFRINHKLLESYLVKLDIHSFITGAAPPKLTLGKLKEVPIPVPKNPREQQKIADCLASLDEVITAHQDKVEALKNHKKGLLQNLFPQEGKKTPNYRFPEFVNDGEWEEKTLGNIGNPSMCKRIFKEETTNNVNDIPFYKIGTFGKSPDSFIPKEIYENYKRRFSFPKKGDILISASGTIGRLVVYNGEPAYFQDSNIVWIDNNEDKVINSFLFYIYSLLDWQTSDGGIIQRLYNSDLKNMKIVFPKNKIEQQKIADCLISVDNLITSQSEKIEQLKTHKKGLMQGLFPKTSE